MSADSDTSQAAQSNLRHRVLIARIRTFGTDIAKPAESEPISCSPKAVGQLRSNFQQRASHFAKVIQNAASSGHVGDYLTALVAVEECRQLLMALTRGKGRSKNDHLGKMSRKKGKYSQQPHHPTRTSRGAKVPLGMGHVHQAQGQTRKPGSRKS